jgi:hypothetical protein
MQQMFDPPIDRSWDHLEAIASTLANLRGGGSLVRELVQNADDAKGATRLTFRFTDDALIIEDDGGFQRCGDLRSARCEWESAGRRCCDFHAFAKLGSATKKHDPNTTGAFGVGFLSVYQVTDRPEIFSAGVHWVIDEEQQSALPCRNCDNPHIRAGTRIVLPWAGTATWLRRKLGADLITLSARKRLAKEFVSEIPGCMLFLRRINRIDVFDGDDHLARFRRSVGDGRVEIRGPQGVQTWLVVTGSFEREARVLRAAHHQIGQRTAEVSLAVRPGHKVEGRLFATLPTRVSTELPLHLNAAFFPRTDRKGILLDAEPEAEWNRAAIRAAADALAASLESLSREMGPTDFWTLVNAASKLDTHQSEDVRVLVPLWERVTEALPKAAVMWTSAAEWESVERIVLAPRTEKMARLLADLNIPTIGKEIRRLVPWRRLGIRTVDLDRLVGAIEHLGIEEESAVGELPAFLQNEQQRDAVSTLLAELVVRSSPDDDLSVRIRALPLWQGVDGAFHSFNVCYLVDKPTAAAVAWLVETPFVVWGKRGPAKVLGDLGLAVDALAGAAADDFTVTRAVHILRFLQSRANQLTQEHVEALRSVPLVPTSTGLRPPRETVRAGGFTDHLAVTGVLDADVTKGLEDILRQLRVQPLTFIDYLRDHLPLALQPGTAVSVDRLVALIRDCGNRRDEIDADQALTGSLAALAWVPCRDGFRHSPTKVYFESAEIAEVLGRDAPLVVNAIPRRSGAASFLRDLGTSNVPRPADVVARVERLIEDAPTQSARAAVRAVLGYVARRDPQLSTDGATLGRLRQLAWLPAEGDSSRWHQPSDLFTTKWKRLFRSAGTFIALQRTEQEALASTLKALGVTTTAPPVRKVVEHVDNLARGAEAPSVEILRWLDERAGDAEISPLSKVAFLLARDGSLNRPDGVFRLPHALGDHLPVLESRVAKYQRLLDALDVKRSPGGDDAVGVLLTAISLYEEGAVAPKDVLRLVRACWQLIQLDLQCDLSQVEGRTVVPTRDGSLRAVGQVVLDDRPGTAQWLSPDARRHVIPGEGIGSALGRAGVEPLSKRLIAEVAGRRSAARNTELEQELINRQRHVARIVVAEHGDLARLLRFFERLRARSLAQLLVCYALEGIDVPASVAASRGAHYDATTGELFVQGSGLDVSWPDLALCIKDELLPNKGPSVTLPIEMVLAAETADDAADFLSDHTFPELAEERWQELRDVQAAWEAAQSGDAETGGSDEADDEVGGDRVDDTDGAMGVDGGESDDRETPDAQDEDASGAEEEHVREGSGAGGAGAGSTAGDASSNGGGSAGQGNGTGHRDGVGGKPGNKRKGRSSAADRRLISYVGSDKDGDSRNESGADRSAAGEAGVDLVVAHLQRQLAGQGLDVVKMPDKNKGYDILVRDTRTGNTVRYVEVKSTEERWGIRGVGLSRPQFELGVDEGGAFALYVVEYLYAQEARIWWIDDPANKVTTFQYDEGWTTAADGNAWVTGAHRPKAAST